MTDHGTDIKWANYGGGRDGGVKMSLWVIGWDLNNVIDIGVWSNCGGGRVERF